MADIAREIGVAGGGFGAPDSLGAYSSFQMGCFFSFSVILVLYGYAEMLHHKVPRHTLYPTPTHRSWNPKSSS